MPALPFARLLRQLRTDVGLTQEELADAAGVSTRTISDLERGVYHTARKETARLLADALSLTGPARIWFEATARGRAPAGEFPALNGVATATRALPRDLSTFTGRASELRQLERGLEPAGVVTVYAIEGMAGVGKSAFAVHVAHRLTPRFTDGQIFLPLHAHTPGHRPVEPTEALGSLLMAVGLTGRQIPSALDARSALWRAHVADKRFLLMLDDAVGYEQVRHLLPGTAGSTVLITSRRRLAALEDAQVISLDTLPENDAAELFVRLAARPDLRPEDPGVRQVIRLCGLLPLALGPLARRLGYHRTWTAADLADDLADSRDRLELMYSENLSVAAAFDLSYQDLTPAQRMLFRRIGLHPGTDVDAYAAAALADAELASASRHLDDLYNQHLLTEPTRGRYRFHDLIREYARGLATTDPPSERDTAIRRLMDYYRHTAEVANHYLARRTPRSALAASDPPRSAPAILDRAPYAQRVADTLGG